MVTLSVQVNMCPKRRCTDNTSISDLSAAANICVGGCAIYPGHNRTLARLSGGRLSQDLRGIPEGPPSSEVVSLLILMFRMEPFFFCCNSFRAECSTVNSAINTGLAQIVDSQVSFTI